MRTIRRQGVALRAARTSRQSDSSTFRLNLETLEDRIALTGDLAILETPVAHAVAEPRDILVAGAGGGGEPRVTVRDAQTNQVLFNFLAYEAPYRGGVNVASGDVNGDGVLDIITAPAGGGGPHIRIFNGVNGSLMTEYFAYSSRPRGVNVAVGDVNNDGFADVITAPGFGGGPHVRVFSGANNSILTEFFAYNRAFQGGVNVASGDVDGDSFDDIIVAPDSGAGPHVRVFSGASPSTQLANFFAYNQSFQGGVNVGVGDVNNDGFDDIITGPSSSSGPHVRAFNVQSLGSPLASFFAFNQTFQGGVTVSSADVNNDNVDDIIVGANSGAPPNVRVFSGTDQSTLQAFRAISWDLLTGVNVGGGISNKAPVVDVNAPLTVAEGGSGTITSANLSTSDDSPAAPVYTITTAPINGALFLNANPLSVSDTFTQTDVDNNLVTYTHDGGETTSDGFGFLVTDDDGASVAGTFSIIVTPVNDRPQVNLDPDDSGGNSPNFSVTFTEDGGPVMLGDVDLSVFDPDSQITGATVQIIGGAINTQDVLAAVDQGGVTSSFNMVLSTLTLTGTASPAVYETVLRSVTYDNTSDNPNTGMRTVEFKVNDGVIDSIGVGSFITVVAVNDPPVLANIETAALAYTEGDGAVEITSTVTVSDVDDTMIESAAIQITGNYQNGEDVLADNGSVPVAISVGAFNATDGSITLSGTATLAEYQTALRAITYENTSVAPSELTRTVSFTVNDGDDDGNTVTRDIEVTSVNTPPMAVADTYDTIGNVRLRVGGSSSGLEVFVTGSVLDNDVDPDSSIMVAPGGLSGITPGASVQLNGNGRFTFTPAPGGPATQGFNYTITDGTNFDTAAVTINIIETVWFVDNTATAGGLGRSTDPFDTLAEAEAASAAGDVIYIFEGDGMDTGQNAGITLKDNQRLIGEGVELSLNVGLNGNAAPAVLRAAGNAPLISHTSDVVTLGNNNEIAGLDIDPLSTGAFADGVAGDSVSGGSLRNVNILLGGGTGPNRGIFLANNTGAFTVTDSTVSGTSGGGTAFVVFGGDAAISFTNTDLIQTSGILLHVESKTGGSVSFDSMGTLSLTNGSFGIFLANNSGGYTTSFNNGFSIQQSVASGTGFIALNTGTVNIGGTSSTINAVGRAIKVSGADTGSGWTFASLSSSASNGQGVEVNNLSGGPVTVTGATTINDSDSHAIIVTNSSANFDFGATSIGQTTAATTGVDIGTGNTGTFTFDSLDVTTSAGAGLITGANTVTIGGTANTLSATGGVAVDANGTNLGGGWTFDNVTASGGANGVRLNNTSNGNVTVSGNTTVNNTTGLALHVSNSSGNFDFGTTSIGQTTAATAGVDIGTSNTGTFTFDSLDVTTSAGVGLVTGNNTVNIGGTTNTINATGGPAINATTTNIGSGWTFDNVTSSGGANGVRLAGLTSGSSSDVMVTGSTMLSNQTAAALLVQGGGTGVDFDFGSTTITSSVAGADIAVSNAGSFVFDSLDATTTAGAALVTGNNSVTIGGTTNTLNATGGAAIVALSTTMTNGAGGGWTFDGLTSSASTSNGVGLDSVSGDLTVTGTTTITNSAAEGIEIDNTSATSDFTFATTSITDSGGNGVDLDNVAGSFTINSTGGGITFNNTVDLHGVRINNSNNVTIGGTDASNRFTITGAGTGSGTSGIGNGTGHHGIVSVNSGDQTYDFVNLTGIGTSGPAPDFGIYVLDADAGATIDVNNSLFSSIGTDATRVEHTNLTGLLTAGFTNNAVSGNGTDFVTTDDGFSLLLDGTSAGRVVANINNNTYTGIGAGIRAVLTGDLGRTTANSLTINNNDVFESTFGLIYRTEENPEADVSIDDLVVDADTGLPLAPNSGPGIDVTSQVIDATGGTGNDVNTSETRLTITNSAVRDQNFEGIRIRHFGDDGANTNQGIITALLDTVTASNNASEGLRAEAGDGGTLNITVRDSNFTGNNSTFEDTRFGFRNQLMGSMPVLRVYLDGTESNDLFRFDGSPNPAEVSELAQEAGGPVAVGTNPVSDANIIAVLNFNGNTTGGGTPLVLTDTSYRDHTTIINVGGVPTPLLAAEGMATGGGANRLTAAELTSIVEAAIGRWADAGITEAQLAHLRAVSVDVSDLPGAQLGGATPWLWTIRLDVDAAGHGWFVDATPDDDSEFTRHVGGTEFAATEAQAAGAIDLLTVVTHELGHILGLADLDPSVAPHQLLTATLPSGARRLIAAPLGVVASSTTSSSGATAPALATAGDTSTSGATDSIVVFSDEGFGDSSGSSETSTGDPSSGGASDEQFSSDTGSDVDSSTGRSHEPHSTGGGLLLLDTEEVARLQAPAVDVNALGPDMIVVEKSAAPALLDVLDNAFSGSEGIVVTDDAGSSAALPLDRFDGVFSDANDVSETLLADVAEETEADESSSEYVLAALAALCLTRPAPQRRPERSGKTEPVG